MPWWPLGEGDGQRRSLSLSRQEGSSESDEESHEESPLEGPGYGSSGRQGGGGRRGRIRAERAEERRGGGGGGGGSAGAARATRATMRAGAGAGAFAAVSLPEPARPAEASLPSWLLRRPTPRKVATVGVVVACSFVAALLLLSRRPVQPAPAQGGLGPGDGPGGGAGGLVSLADWGQAGCVDSPGWSNGMSDCQYQVLGDDPSLCTPQGWTCAGYVAKGLCGGPEGPKSFAMGPALNSPEKNCCACKDFQREGGCDKDTGGTCRVTGKCDGWRGSAICQEGKCVCPDGYCNGEGTCQLDSRSAWMQRGNAEEEVELTSSCTRDTGGTCVFFGKCDGYRGNVSCQMGLPPKCFCAEGYCVDHGGMCFRDRGIVTAAVAPVSLSHRQFPGDHSRIRTALCVSGGGSRSMSAALGQFRSLARLGLLPAVDMISAVSGGAWASSILMFAAMDLKELLGLARSLEPATLTMQELGKDPPPFGAVLMNPTVKKALNLRMKKVPFRLLWVETIGEAFLQPFGLDDLHAYMALDQKQVDSIIARNPKFRDAVFHTVQSGRAKNIIMNGCLLAPSGYKASSNNAVSFQASPDFTGVPFFPNNTKVDYENSAMGKPALKGVLTGGGLIETFAFGASHPMKRKEQQGGDSIKLIAPAAPFSLVKAVGISSAAFGGQASSMVAAGVNVNPQIPLWPVTSREHPRPQVAMQHQFGDGGNLENTGILAVLQRGATKIAAMINSCDPTATDSFFCDAASAGKLSSDPKGKISSQFAQLFGYAKSASSMEFLTHNQVFRQEDFWPIACQMQRLKSAGRAQLLRASLIVVENTWWGIEGGSSVDIIFFILDKAAAFEEQLPADTRQQLRLGPVGPLANFPQYRTMFNNLNDMTQLTAPQINLLAAQADWALSANESAFRSLFGETTGLLR